MIPIKTFEKVSHPDPEIRAKRQTLAYIVLLGVALIWLFYGLSSVFKMPEQATDASNQILMNWDDGVQRLANPVLMLLVSSSLLYFVLHVRRLSGAKKLGATVGLILWVLVASVASLIGSTVVVESARTKHEGSFVEMGFSPCGEIDAVRRATLKGGSVTLRKETLAIYQKNCAAVDIKFSENLSNHALQVTANPQIPFTALMNYSTQSGRLDGVSSGS